MVYMIAPFPRGANADEDAHKQPPLRPRPGMLLLLVPPFAVTIVLWGITANPLSPVEAMAALVLSAIPWWAFQAWRREPRTRLPLFAMIGVAYWVAYAAPLFFGDRRSVSKWATTPFLSDFSLSEAMILPIVGLASMWLGTRALSPRATIRGDKQTLENHPPVWWYLRVVCLLGILPGLNGSLTSTFGDGGQQVLTILQSSVPLTAFLLLFVRYVRDGGRGIDRLFVPVFILGRLVVGLSSGWLGDGAWFLVACALVYVTEKRRFPVAPAIVILAMIFFLQPAKHGFRDAVWADYSGSAFDRAAAWVNASWAQWSGALSDESTASPGDLAYASVARSSLLQQTASVFELTPTVVPHQGPSLYGYLVVGWIPRAVWPGKPSFNQANQAYQVLYGITDERDLQSVSIAVGTLAESYISFGWVGVMVILFLVGLVVGVFQRVFILESSGPLATAIGIVLALQFVKVESQLVQYLSGLAQHAIMCYLIVAPAFSARVQRAFSPTRNHLDSRSGITAATR